MKTPANSRYEPCLVFHAYKEIIDRGFADKALKWEHQDQLNENNIYLIVVICYAKMAISGCSCSP